MTKRFSLSLLSMLLVLLVVLSVSSVAIAQDDDIVVVIAPDEPVKIGLAAALSGEGLVLLGEDILHGAELALVNRPVVTVGDVEFTVELDPQDDLCSSEGGQTVANLFTVDESIVGVVGPMCTSAVNGALPIFESAGYTIISPSATGDTLTETDSPSFNRTCPRDSFQGNFAAPYIYNELGVTRIATIHDGSPYAEGLVEIVTELFEELGGEVVAADAVTVGSTDFRALLEEIAQAEPELIYFPGFPAEAARLIEQRADAGLEDVMFMGADGVWGAETISLAGDTAEGVFASVPVADSEGYADYLEQYVEAYGMEPPAAFGAYSYDATNLLLDAIEAVGELDDDGNLVISRAALAEYIRSFEPVQGISGLLEADGTGEMTGGVFGLYQVQEGEWVEIASSLGEEDSE